MLTKGINFVNFKIKKNSTLVKKNLISILKSKNEVLNSLSQNYKNNFTKKLLHKYKKKIDYRVIGMGGSSLGTQTIYDFLKHKIRKNFVFADNLQAAQIKKKKRAVYWVSSSLKKDNSNFINSPLVVPIFYNFGKLSFKNSLHI